MLRSASLVLSLFVFSLYCVIFITLGERWFFKNPQPLKSFALLSNILFQKRGLTKIICAPILLQINLKGRNLSHQIFFSAYLLACYLLTGLYNFYSRPKFCKVYLYCFVSLLTLFLYFLLSYIS